MVRKSSNTITKVKIYLITEITICDQNLEHENYLIGREKENSKKARYKLNAPPCFIETTACNIIRFLVEWWMLWHTLWMPWHTIIQKIYARWMLRHTILDASACRKSILMFSPTRNDNVAACFMETAACQREFQYLFFTVRHKPRHVCEYAAVLVEFFEDKKIKALSSNITLNIKSNSF